MKHLSAQFRAAVTAAVALAWVALTPGSVAALRSDILWTGASAKPQLSSTTLVRTRIFVPRANPGRRCNLVYPLWRTVRAPALLTGAMRELLKGPTRAERRRGYGGWFSTRTAGMLRSARVAAGVAYVDFANFSRIIPSASSSCGSRMLLAQLDRTAQQFPTVRKGIYSFNGSRRAFYEWLQLSPPAGRS